MWIPIFLVPLAVQWWSSWYPGAEPGGGGYIAQRMLAAKDEKNAVGATLLFNIAHYALRPWPWILIALCSIVFFPDIASLREAFPNMDPGFVDDDLAFPAMLTKLPHGLLGLVIASLIAAYMSTISTHLNWGASYVVHDFYRRFVDKDAAERKLVNLGRLTTVLLMVLSGIVALWLNNAYEAFNILLQLGAGTGLIFILRWFWWRINAYSEIAAMIISFIVAGYFKWNYQGDLLPHQQLVVGVAITTVGWLVVTFLTRPTDVGVLKAFITRIQPYPAGWKRIIRTGNLEVSGDSTMGLELIAMLVGCVMVYGALFTTGYIIYGQLVWASLGILVTVSSGFILRNLWRRLKFH